MPTAEENPGNGGVGGASGGNQVDEFVGYHDDTGQEDVPPPPAPPRPAAPDSAALLRVSGGYYGPNVWPNAPAGAGGMVLSKKGTPVLALVPFFGASVPVAEALGAGAEGKPAEAVVHMSNAVISMIAPFVVVAGFGAWREDEAEYFEPSLVLPDMKV